MNVWSKIGAIGFGVIVAATLALATVSRQSPTDKALRDGFIAHRADFERLVAMANEDKVLSRIAFDFTWLNDDVAWPRKNVGISSGRWDDYRHEFRRVGASIGIIKKGNPTRIMFPIKSTGLVPTGSEKGLVFSQEPLSPVLSSLDKRPPNELWDGMDRSHVLAYKPIDDHWYIFYEEW